jgi:hypothetical protein
LVGFLEARLGFPVESKEKKKEREEAGGKIEKLSNARGKRAPKIT